MTVIGCTHRKVTTYFFVDGNQPAGLWACADCGRKFEPVNIAVEKDAARYRHLKSESILGIEQNGCGWSLHMPQGIAPDSKLDIDAAVDASMAVGAA